jgi:enoyl-[acyl-carrier protein] reductase II
MAIHDQITELLAVEYPINQAAMGWIARFFLASAVSNAGGLGTIATSSGRLDEVREEVR